MTDQENGGLMLEAAPTIYWIEAFPSGQIYSSSSVPSGVTPTPIKGGSMIVVDRLCSPNESAYYDGEVVNIGRPETVHHEFDFALRAWVDRRDLAFYKDERWGLIKKARDDAEFGGFTWDGSVFDSDSVSQSRIQGAVVLAGGVESFSISWTLADNSTRLLSGSEMLGVGVALGEHVNAQHERARALRAQIAAATSVNALQAIVWPAS